MPSSIHADERTDNRLGRDELDGVQMARRLAGRKYGRGDSKEQTKRDEDGDNSHLWEQRE